MRKLLLFVLLCSLIVSQFLIVSVSGAFEDFDTYTTMGDVVTDGVRVNATLNMNQDDYAYRDLGAGYFDDFVHALDIFQNGSVGNPTVLGNFWMLANVTNDEKGIRDAASQTYLAIDALTLDAGNNWRLRLKYWNDAALIQDFWIGYNINTMYYLRVNRTGTALVCQIYSDSPRTNLLDTLTIVSTTGTYQYVYGCNSWNDGNNRKIQVMVENLDLDAAPESIDPTYDLMGLNSTVADAGIQFTINLSDNVELDTCFLEWNNTGTLTNVSLTLSGTNFLCLFNQTLNATEDARVDYRFFFNDTSDNWGETIQHFLYTTAVAAVSSWIVSAFNWTTINPNANTSILFNATYSNSSDSITEYSWNFGDGNTTTGNYETITHQYLTNGTYTITLNITSVAGSSNLQEGITIGETIPTGTTQEQMLVTGVLIFFIGGIAIFIILVIKKT